MTADDRIAILLADEATGNLGKADRAELAELLTRHPDVDRYAYDRAAAMVFLAAAGARQEKLPASLNARLERDAEQAFGSQD